MERFINQSPHHADFPGGAGPERQSKEKRLITPESLINDNNSFEANRRMDRWYYNYVNGRITLLIRCSDARIINPDPESIMTINTVAASEDFDQYIGMLTETPFQNIAFIGHFDGEKLKSTNLPKGCGAHDAWEAIQKGEVENPNGIFKRVVENLIGADPVLQVNYNARQLADLTLKPVLALVQNHRNGENIPVGVYYSEGDSLHGVTPRDIARLQDKIITPEDAYWSKSIPRLRKEEIPFGFYNLLEQGEENSRQRRHHIGFTESQEIQNPQAIYLGVDFQPIEVRFPKTFGEPNTGFRLLIPRRRTNEKLTENSIQTAIDHAEYPLIYAIKNYGKGGNFADTNTVFIETKSMSTSDYIANQIAETSFGEAFLNLSPQHQIIIGETRKGRLIDARKFKSA